MDILHDNSHSILFQISNNYEMPKYVMDSELLDKSAADKLSDRLFADPVGREYPINSKANTWLSAAYLAKTAENNQPVEKTILKAAETYGIKDDVTKIMTDIKNPGEEKSASDDDSNYGYPEEKRYPMFDSDGVKKANAYFEENAYLYPAEMRKKIASNILKKSAAYHIIPSETVRMEAGYGIPRRDFMTAQILDRAHRTDNEKAVSALLKANEAILTASPTEVFGVLDKIAEVVSDFDEMTGLNYTYGRTVIAPSQFIYDIPVKEAEEMVEDTVVLGDNAFCATKLAELPASVYASTLGDDFVSRVEKDGEINPSLLADELNSLPAPDKSALVDSIKAITE